MVAEYFGIMADMCGRFALSRSDRIDWAQFGVRRGPALPPHWTCPNCATEEQIQDRERFRSQLNRSMESAAKV